MSKSDTINLTIDLTITKRWAPVFMGFLDKLYDNSKNGHSSLVAFYADGDGDFGFKANIPPEENPDLLREFGFKNYEDKLVVDREKALGKPIAKDVDCPALWCDKVEEVYDAG